MRHALPPAATDSPGPLGPWIDRLLEVGGGVVPALRALGAALPRHRRGDWDELCETLAAGDAARAARALDRAPDTWIPFVSVVAPGTTTGDGVAEAAFLRRAVEAVDSASRGEDGSRWWLPLVYPLFVMGLAIGVVCLLAALVVPPFQQILDDFGTSLPPLTEAVVSLSAVIRAGWPWLLLGLALAAALLLTARAWWPAWLRLPGSWFARSGRFARRMGDLLSAGVPLPGAVEVAARTIDPHGGVDRDGLPPWLSGTVRWALADDMPSATRIRLLGRIADCHDDRLAVRRAWAAWCLGPVAVFVTGLCVLLLVLALFMPLIKLVNDLS